MVSVRQVLAGAGAGGALFGALIGFLKEELEKGLNFRPILESVKSTVDRLRLLIPKIEDHNNALGGDRGGEVEKLKQTIYYGIYLIQELQTVNDWSLLKSTYTDELLKLDEDLKGHLTILQLQEVADVKETLVEAKDTNRDVKKILALTNDISGEVKENLALTKDTSGDVKENLALTKDTSGDVKENLALTKDTSGDVKENLALTKDTRGDVKENLALTKDTRGDVKENLALTKEIERRMKEMTLNKAGWHGVPEPPPFTVGIHLDELKKKLLDDGGSMALITGLPGSGKTTLAKAFCQHKEVKDKFKIIFVNVSERSNTEVVQEICEKEGNKVSGFQTEEIALDRLQQLLKNTGLDPVLLVLDNVWRGNRTNSLLASLKPKESKKSNYKILVTSRYEFSKFDVVCHIKELNDEDAMSLLRNSASPAVTSIPEDLQRKVVECCKRLPLLIDVIGRSLSDRDIVIWKDRVEAWSSGRTSFISENGLLAFLQSSLDALGEKEDIIKELECFKDLASFPQGRRIPASVLIDMCSVHFDREEAYKDGSCIAKLNELTYWRLANLVITRNEKEEMDDYYGEHYVTQHDLLRELAIHQTDGETPKKRLIVNIRGDNPPKWWKKQMDQPFEEVLPRQSSLLDDTNSQFTSKWRDLRLPKAKVLVLNFHTESYALPEFVEKMKKLVVLIVTNHGFLPAEVSNFTLLGSLSKLRRIRLERIFVSSFTKNRIELKRLQKISFFMCNMGQTFSKGSNNFFEAFPELQEVNIDYCGDLVELPADICHLIYLKKLSITNCHKLSALPEMIGDLVNLEILRLMSCTELSELPSSVGKLEKLNVLDISKCFSIKKLPKKIGELCSLEKLNMRECWRLKKLPKSVLGFERLKEVICDERTEELWERFLPSLSGIKIRMVKEEISLEWLLQKLYS